MSASPTAGEPVRVLVNGLHAKSGGGVTYLRNLLPRLGGMPGLAVTLLIHADQAALYPEPGVAVHRVRFRNGFLARLAWEQTVLPVVARRLGTDVTFSPANFGPLFAPNPVIVLRNALAVGTVERRPVRRLYWAALALMTRLALATSRRAIAVSGYAVRTLAPPRLAAGVAVIPHGVAPTFSPPPAGWAREGFVLAVSDLYIQKNLHTLIDAMSRLRIEFPDLTLAIAGRPVDADYAERLRNEVETRGLATAVRFLGPVEPADLVGLYRRCAVFVFPSTVETFGNPLVEALACGAPVAAADATAIPEVLGGAGVLFDPLDADAMAAAVAGLLRDPERRRALSAAAVVRARAFSWERTATATAAVLRAAAAGPAARPDSAWEAVASWLWVAGMLAAWAWQFRDLAGPVHRALGLG